MKVDAYRCNYCGHIKDSDEITGINPTEDMFNKLDSYPITTKLHTTNIHFCIECYKDKVVKAAEIAIDRKRFEEQYKMKIKELGYGFRYQTVYNSRKGIFSVIVKNLYESKG